jgi:chemotaxis protein methyltransferase CheR
MVIDISEKLLSEFCEFVTDNMGLYFPKERWKDLERGIYASALEFNFEDMESFIYWLMSSPLKKNQIEILASYLTVGETYFFREKRSFEVLGEHILPEIIRLKRGNDQRLRIWSAGCCTGEEPYSIAILINKLLPDLKDWNITILGTDINPRFLQKASEGVYNNWSFRDNPLLIKETFFRQKNSKYEMLPHIKKMVNFTYLNLAEDVYPSLINNTNAMDIIFCRNVLMYFSPKLIKKVIQNIYHSLLEGGWLIVSSSEISHVHFKDFVSIDYPGFTVYKKDNILSQNKYIIKDFLTDEIISAQTIEESQYTFQTNLNVFKEPEIQPAPIEGTDRSLELEEKKTNRIDSTQDLHAEALTLIQQCRFQEAIEKVTILLSQNQEDTKAMALLSKILANQGNLNEALKWCEKSIHIDKLNPEYYYLRSAILQEKGIINEAIISLKQTLYLDQNFVLAYFALGNLALHQGRIKESNKYFENALLILKKYHRDEIPIGSDGITAGRFIEIINSMTVTENSL